MVPNRDIGFVHAGQEAEIKVDTFNFTRYGLLHGQVISVSPDAIPRDKPQDRRATNGGPPERRQRIEGQPGTDLQRARSRSTERRCRSTAGWSISSPGMAVTVEIKTGSRRIISYLLSPIAKYTHDTLHER